MSRLTLCVIARDEMEMLPDCLASAAGVVDEIVVVDAGSSDRTAEIARAAGAIVVPHVWSDDFAAARNAALPHVTGDWILVLDADERLAPGGDRAVRAAIAVGGFDLGLLPVHNASSLEASVLEVVAGRARRGEPTLLGRLLRRTPDLQWHGVIHESTGSWPSDGPRRDRAVAANIIHYGYTPARIVQRAKRSRNLALLRRRCAQDPSDHASFTYLARALLAQDRPKDAHKAAQVAWTLLEARVAQGIDPDAPVLPTAAITTVTLFADLEIQDGQLSEARAILEGAVEWAGFHPNFGLLIGVSHEKEHDRHAGEEREKHLMRAAASYQRCIDAAGTVYAEEVSAGATSWYAGTRLAAVLLFQGEVRAALIAFEKARLMLPPGTNAQDSDLAGRALVEITLGTIEAFIRLDQWREVLPALEPLLEAQVPDAWVLAAMACKAGGQRADAEALIRPAATAAREDFVSPHRHALAAELLRA